MQPNGEASIVALVATRARPELLLSRAIPSILGQKRLPEQLLVVVDQGREEWDAQAKIIHSLCRPRLRTTVLRNFRTQGRAAGAWNTGLDFLSRDPRTGAQPSLCFVAILDDDDAWSPEHLEACIAQALAENLSMVTPGLIRHSHASDEGHYHTIPAHLDPRELFIRGQHIQGSNLFVRLDLLLKSGGFDEYLPSCTDRDLCIRLADLPDLRFGKVDKHTVHHFADPRPDRLSAPESPAKLEGLSRFWRKYKERFDQEARRLALERAYERFGWKPEPPLVSTVEIAPSTLTPPKVDLIAGLVSDAHAPICVRGLLEDLLALSHNTAIRTLQVVLVENGPLPTGGARPLHRLSEAFRERGLDLQLISIERQREDWLQGLLTDAPNPANKRMKIAVSRTVLNSYVSRAAAERPGSWAWILDDDKRLTVRIERGDGTILERLSPDIAALCTLRDKGVDVVLGPDTNAPPLPFAATIRVQLVDLLHHIHLLQNARPDDAWPLPSFENVGTQRILQDNYYDLSRLTEHLETPFTLGWEAGLDTAHDAAAYIASKVHRIFAGEAVFRPLSVDERMLPADAAVDSIRRGGSALFFEPQVLQAYPHTLARLGERYTRRSDMLVSLLMRHQQGLRIVIHPSVGVSHDRSTTRPENLDSETLWDDLLGYAFYRTLELLLEARPLERRQEPLLAFDAEELNRAVRYVRKYIHERLGALRLNSFRVVGLAESIQRAIQELISMSPHWGGNEEKEALTRVSEAMKGVCTVFEPNKVRALAQQIEESLPDADIENAFSAMDAQIRSYRLIYSPMPYMYQAFEASRERRARALLSRVHKTGMLRMLGAGGEGIIFTDDTQVFKVFDLPRNRPNHNTQDLLRELGERNGPFKHLYPLKGVEVHNKTLLIRYPYEASEPYSGGLGPELIGLLRECKAQGIVFQNMHPKNLRVSATGLKLVDFGADLRPFSDAAYRSMAERAWLSWRFAHRKDLDILMRRALVDKTLPELDGFERFWTVLLDEKPSATRIVADALEKRILESGAKTVLDYGCGKQAYGVRRLAEAGCYALGFDPGPSMPKAWASLGSFPTGLELSASREMVLHRRPFQALVCSLVLCELEDGPAYEQVLQDLRLAVHDHGLAFITICNPFATFGGPTPLHWHRDLPPGLGYEDCFWYKEMGETAHLRSEFHRPLRRIEHDLLRHGFRVIERIESKAVDLERFEPASDFMTLICQPLRPARSDRLVSLVIKTCAMEAGTIERQVEHLCQQLSGPHVFAERLLALDPLRDGFTRQYANADFDALRTAAERLVRRGLIDRVFVGPSETRDLKRLNAAWFGLSSSATHTAAGAPLGTPLQAFELCSGEFILQVDSDLLIGRSEREYDFLGEMIDAIHAHPKAITASLNVAQASESSPFSSHQGGQPWRVEARGSLFHRTRLLKVRPFPNTEINGHPQLSWHRAIDEAVKDGRIDSLRGGNHSTFFVHPPNELKRDSGAWMLLLDGIEKGNFSASQVGNADFCGNIRHWLPRNRAEPFIFLVTGRNVAPGRLHRCLDTITAQTRDDWGAIIIDDGSNTWTRDYLPLATEAWQKRITLLQPRESMGQLANMVLAISHVCTNPQSVIITLDMDDALLGPKVLERVARAYREGADLSVGSMLRTDKHKEYPVRFEDARKARGGNVWQHLRTFRKWLFDAIPDEDLRLDGHYVDIAVDWAFMLPMVEMARAPHWLREALYLYEPSGMGKYGAERVARERQIAAILAKPPRKKLDTGY